MAAAPLLRPCAARRSDRLAVAEPLRADV